MEFADAQAANFVHCLCYVKMLIITSSFLFYLCIKTEENLSNFPVWFFLLIMMDLTYCIYVFNDTCHIFLVKDVV